MAPLIILFALALAGAATPLAQAQTDKHRFDIPAQPLGAALQTLADQAGVQMFYAEDSAAGKATPALRSEYTTREAVNKLLAGTGLTAALTEDGTVTVAEADPEPEAEPETVILPTITVTASPIDDTSYNVQDATTATRIDTPVMETPYSVKAVPQQVLQDQQVFRLDKALQNVSGVITARGGQRADLFTIRGFASGSNGALYRDGSLFPQILTLGFSANRETANLERIEVLKGPGSLLFGRTQPGGIINLVTKQPLASPYYALQQQFGSFDFYRTTADASGPLTRDDTLLHRVNLSYENAGSFRDFDSNERVFVAPVLRWNIGPRTQATLELEYQHVDELPDAGIPAIGNRPAPVPRERSTNQPSDFSRVDRILAGFNWSHSFNDRWSLKHRFYANLLDFDFQATGQVSAAGPDGNVARNHVRRGAPFDSYFTGVDLTGKVETWGLRHTLLFGGDYYRTETKSTGTIIPLVPTPFNVFNPRYGTPLDPIRPASARDQTGSWYGLYFQDQVELPYQLFALGGFRYDQADRRDNLTDTKTGDDNRVSPRGGLLWRPIPELSFYGSYTENFGISNGITADNKALPPETAQQWEVGAKTELWDGRFSATFAYFDLTRQNIAVPDPINPFLTTAIGEGESRGVELDLAGEILPGWQVIGGYSYLPFAEITKDVGFDGGPGNQGKRLFNAPRHAGSLWSTYEFQGGDVKGLKLGGGVVAVGQREGNAENRYQIPGYASVNLLASYSMKVGPTKLTAQLNVDNLFDKTYFAGSNGSEFIFFGAPRTFLGSIRVEY